MSTMDCEKKILDYCGEKTKPMSFTYLNKKYVLYTLDTRLIVAQCDNLKQKWFVKYDNSVWFIKLDDKNIILLNRIIIKYRVYYKWYNKLKRWVKKVYRIR